MVQKCILLLTTLICLVLHNTYAQESIGKDKEKELRKEASSFMKSENYKEAMKLYEQLAAALPAKVEYSYNLGVCILNSNVLREKAIEPLEKAAGSDLKEKDINFHLGLAYMYANEFDKAIEQFEKFRSLVKSKMAIAYKLDLHLNWCYNAKDLIKSPITVDFKNISSVNSEYADFNPLVEASDSIMIFTSNRNTNQGRRMDESGEYPSDLYMGTASAKSRARVRNLGINVNSWYYDKGLSFSPNGQTILLSKEGEKGEIDLYVSEKGGRSFLKASILSDKFFTKYDEYNACFSADGNQLFFAAEMKGGYGGLDIYRCEKQSNGVWTEPVNLGDVINTVHDEDNPQLYIDDKTLFFSSEGHNSMGGMDVFKSVKPSPQQAWTKPENLGYPLNDVYDNNDFFLSAIASWGYISAVREEGMGDRDIYRVTFDRELVTTDLQTVFIQVFNPSGQVSKNTAVNISKKSTGEKVGRVLTGSFGEITQFLPPGEYSLVIKTRKLGQFEQVMSVPETSEKSVHIRVDLVD